MLQGLLPVARTCGFAAASARQQPLACFFAAGLGPRARRKADAVRMCETSAPCLFNLQRVSQTMRIAAAVCLFVLGAGAFAQEHADSCQALIPRSLADALAATFRGYRAPLEYDNAPDDIARNREKGGTGCLGVAIADFTGEGKKEYVIGLTALKSSAGLAVIALPRKGGWRFQKIRSASEDARFRQFVEVAEPGRYERDKSRSASLAADERTSLECPNAGVHVGALQGASAVYCYRDGHWLHVWVSNQ